MVAPLEFSPEIGHPILILSFRISGVACKAAVFLKGMAAFIAAPEHSFRTSQDGSFAAKAK